ncbi:NIPSNAP family protein [Nonomuraea typhae]|uniref:NIPSNAP family protein n=1 Tax=Nonomuraea typhae TaxID=2603600 RepID=A0ABW7YSH7_9ACTN
MIYELRRYTLRPGTRDALIELFEREFVETQEEVGIELVAQFREPAAPDAFVWIRAFPDMDARQRSLTAFYTGPAWKAHRDAARATMIDTDDVLLLRSVLGEPFGGVTAPRAPVDAGAHAGAHAGDPAGPESGAPPAEAARPEGGDPPPEAAGPESGAPPAEAARPESGGPPAEAAGPYEMGVYVLTVFHVADGFTERFAELAPGAVACFETEPAANTYTPLPVREGVNVFAWFTAGADKPVLEGVDELLTGPPEQYVLQPTARSRVR